MNRFQDTFRQMLLARIDERQRDVTGQLAAGTCANGPVGLDRIGGEYLRKVGYLQAISDVEIMIDDILKEIRGD